MLITQQDKCKLDSQVKEFGLQGVVSTRNVDVGTVSLKMAFLALATGLGFAGRESGYLRKESHGPSPGAHQHFRSHWKKPAGKTKK